MIGDRLEPGDGVFLEYRAEHCCRPLSWRLVGLVGATTMFDNNARPCTPETPRHQAPNGLLSQFTHSHFRIYTVQTQCTSKRPLLYYVTKMKCNIKYERRPKQGVNNSQLYTFALFSKHHTSINNVSQHYITTAKLRINPTTSQPSKAYQLTLPPVYVTHFRRQFDYSVLEESVSAAPALLALARVEGSIL